MKGNSMDYKTLTADQLATIRQDKLLAIEADHARITLDVQLAARVGITEGESIAQAKANLALLERQHADLLAIIDPPAGDPLPVAANNGATAPAPAVL